MKKKIGEIQPAWNKNEDIHRDIERKTMEFFQVIDILTCKAEHYDVQLKIIILLEAHGLFSFIVRGSHQHYSISNIYSIDEFSISDIRATNEHRRTMATITIIFRNFICSKKMNTL